MTDVLLGISPALFLSLKSNCKVICCNLISELWQILKYCYFFVIITVLALVKFIVNSFFLCNYDEYSLMAVVKPSIYSAVCYKRLLLSFFHFRAKWLLWVTSPTAKNIKRGGGGRRESGGGGGGGGGGGLGNKKTGSAYRRKHPLYLFNLLYTGGIFHRNMLDESIYHWRVSGLFSHFILFFMETPVSKQCRPWLDAT